jgi:hypothetical protein
VLFVGNDWAEDHHDVEIVDEQGRRLAGRRLREGLEGITRLHALIAQFFPEGWATLSRPRLPRGSRSGSRPTAGSGCRR